MKRRGRGVFLLILPDGKSVFAECCFLYKPFSLHLFHCMLSVQYNIFLEHQTIRERGGAVGKTSVLTLALTSQFGTFSVLNYTHISTH